MLNIFWITFTLFLLMDAMGNIPIYLALLKKVPPKRQYVVIFREMTIALATIILFNFLGEGLLRFLHISQNTIQIAGGIILFILALNMIFSKEKNVTIEEDGEPVVVPLAIPLIAGPAVLAAVMVFSHQVGDLIMVSAIFFAWLMTLIILLAAPFLQRILGKKGVLATEKLMGLILTLLSVEMFLDGLRSFLHIPA